MHVCLYLQLSIGQCRRRKSVDKYFEVELSTSMRCRNLDARPWFDVEIWTIFIWRRKSVKNWHRYFNVDVGYLDRVIHLQYTVLCRKTITVRCCGDFNLTEIYYSVHNVFEENISCRVIYLLNELKVGYTLNGRSISKDRFALFCRMI